MKRKLLLLYVLASTTSVFAQSDSAKSFQTGKDIADSIAKATGTDTNIWYVVASTAAPLIFGWIWHVTHLNKKIKSLSK